MMVYYGTIAAALGLGGWAALSMYRPRLADGIVFYAGVFALYAGLLIGKVHL